MSDDVLWLDATAQAAALRDGEIGAVELFELAVDRLATVDANLAVLVHERFDAARNEILDCADEAPFAGVPMVLKDLIAHVAGEPLVEGVAGVARRRYVAREDTELVRHFRGAGLVIAAMTKCSELGILPTTEPALYGPARNPWDRDRSTMGSSGGSAAAVASGAVAIGHGNDLGGSLRSPASACGIVGLKPSRGRVSLAPDFGDFMGGIAGEFAMTRSVRDAAALLDAVAVPSPGDPYEIPRVPSFAGALREPTGPLRVAIVPDGAPACRGAVEVAARALEDMGHRVEVSRPAALDEPEYGLHLFGIITAATEWSMAWWHRALGEPLGAADVEPLTWWLAEQSRRRTPGDYLSTIEWLQKWSRRVAAWWGDGFDLLVTPTMADVPPPLGSFTFDPESPVSVLLRVTELTPLLMCWNVTGSPAISLPLATADDLPVGVQLVAPPGADSRLLAVAAQLEEALPWKDRRPPTL